MNTTATGCPVSLLPPFSFAASDDKKMRLMTERRALQPDVFQSSSPKKQAFPAEQPV
jgi:hypothetical protein